MQTTVTTLLAQALHQEQQRHQAALAAIESRKQDIASLDHLVLALRARGWKIEALVEPRTYGSHVALELVALVSCSEPELCDILEFLERDGVHATRRVTGDIGCSREYLLKLDRFAVRMNAYVHTPARVAA